MNITIINEAKEAIEELNTDIVFCENLSTDLDELAKKFGKFNFSDYLEGNRLQEIDMAMDDLQIAIGKAIDEAKEAQRELKQIGIYNSYLELIPIR